MHCDRRTERKLLIASDQSILLAYASGFLIIKNGRRGVTPTVEPAYVGHFTGNMASCHFPLADLRRLVLTRASGPRAYELGRRGVTPTVEPAYVTSAGRMPERRHIRVSRSLEGEGERPAR